MVHLFSFRTFVPLMRIQVITLLFGLLGVAALAQKSEPTMSIYSWKINPKLGNEYRTNVDTVPLDFQEYNTGDGYRSPRGYLGNLGSPSYSRIFFQQRELPRFIFSQVYEPFFLTAEKTPFFNTTIPLMNLSYLSGGSGTSKEDRFKALFTANSGKRLNIGADMDYINARGFYQYQSVSDFTYKLFGSYKSDKYSLHAFAGNSNLSNMENGGITDDRYITDPLSMSGGTKILTTSSIPVRLEQAQTWNRVNGGTVFLNHRYNLGFYKKIKKDTIETEQFIPVTSFIHTLEYNNIFRRYISKSPDSTLYANTYLHNSNTNDTTSYKALRNTFGISLLEGFNKYALFGLTAYIQNEIRQFRIMDTLGKTRYNEQSTFIGAVLSRKNGRTINYHANAELGILGEDLGQMTLSGELQTNLKLLGRTVQFNANGFIKNLNPGFYLNRYHSKHFWWDRSFKNERRVRIEGELTVPEEHFSLKGGVENLQNYIYFDKDALPAQNSDNIQVLSGCLSKDFKWGILHLDNEIYGQVSSDKKIIPLPAVSLYHNLYICTKLARVLTLQTGFNVRYFSSYYALDYEPAISQFHLQDVDNKNKRVEIGGYPLVNAYANLQLKRTRFFIMYYHVNEGIPNSNYFNTPHYPINPRVMKVGISWNFNN